MVEAAALVAPNVAVAPLTTRVHAGAKGLERLKDARAPSPFQSAGWVAAWLQAHGTLQSFRMIEIAASSGASLLLPLELKASRLGLVACKIGEAHASFFVPARIGEPGDPDPAALRAALIAGARALGADALILPDCPARYAGERHPLAALFSRIGPNDGSGLTLESDGDALIARLLDRDARRKLKQKQAKLASLGPLRLGFATSAAEIDASLSAFHTWKARQFASSGIANPFAEPAIRRFLSEASHADPPAIRHYTLHVGDRLVAMLAPAGGPGPLSVMITAFDADPAIARSSPGEVTFTGLIRAAAQAGIRHLDLGAGEARYKHRFAPETIPLHDIALAVTPRGHLAVACFLATRTLKGAIKRNPALFDLAMRMRRLLGKAG